MGVNIVPSFADRPMGMQDGYPDFAKRRRHIESGLIDFFDKAGYELVSSGAFEYVETLLRARPVEAARDWVQLFDGGGNTIALRPEMTPSIARMAAPLVSVGKLPIRWCYAERVYRRTNDPASLSWASGKAAESTQVGIELIGEAGHQSDADMLALCHEAALAIGLSDTQIVVSHARFVPALLRALGIAEDGIPRLLNCLTSGDYVAFTSLLPLSISIDVLSVLQQLTPFSSTGLDGIIPESAWLDEAARGEVLHAWQTLRTLAIAVEERGLTDYLTFDLTLHRDITYYTGLVFEMFAPGVGAPIAQGGRYDDLLEQFGASAPAIGLAFEVERVMAVLRAATHETDDEGGTGAC
ncbi:ATP phosphoribosyltransferase regulatory subunit [Alicyclobacillus dauci]|uniref:ATP phosphoribosyltransferase regulatory subunit n=1 Tax=Alicyclobacillus dauci TaxID=1475485 RepID=A0ABY6Z068_9BACL|nr:ATP phosphoribosyltransferase regulatory subunit [Alicyclobacillus dauci]WAH35913.1 ATP phosphoribosyltransferase regulatory subunit [Alicyclobacillus dauci]